MIRLATNDDIAFLSQNERHISPQDLQRKIAAQEEYVATTVNDEIVGWLRYGLFWDLIPFMNILFVLEPHRGCGYGRKLVERWEQDMCHSGTGIGFVLTSTQADENAQHFYRHLGYAEVGVLLLPGQTAELFFQKRIQTP